MRKSIKADKTLERVLAGKTYEEFKDRLATSGCPRCPLALGRTKIVVDRGNPLARIMVVGEGPGGTEDRQGRAFVGQAGRVLDEVMAAVGLDTNRDMLIANVVRCRPPDNRPPTRLEAETCLPYLRRQMELVDPAVVVLLGATALKHLAPQKHPFSLKDEVGKFFNLEDHPGRRFVVFYHPAALLYNPRLRSAMRDHAESLRDYLEKAKT